MSLICVVVVMAAPVVSLFTLRAVVVPSALRVTVELWVRKLLALRYFLVSLEALPLRGLVAVVTVTGPLRGMDF
jgi:hypothetical protein